MGVQLYPEPLGRTWSLEIWHSQPCPLGSCPWLWPEGSLCLVSGMRRGARPALGYCQSWDSSPCTGDLLLVVCMEMGIPLRTLSLQPWPHLLSSLAFQILPSPGDNRVLLSVHWFFRLSTCHVSGAGSSPQDSQRFCFLQPCSLVGEG